MNYLYLIVDLAAISVPFLFSFYPKIQFYKQWQFAWPAILLATVLFVIWDSYFTQIGVWGFTPDYLTGVSFFHLPIEEILFFICIPYACLFTYFCFGIFKDENFKLKHQKRITLIILAFVTAGIFLFNDKLYTLYTCVGLGIFLIVLEFVAKVKWLSLFYFSHMFLLIPFFIVNGILTGTGLEKPIVWYNDNENMGIRLLTIPAEDIFYGMLMLLLNTFLFELFREKYSRDLARVGIGTKKGDRK